MSLELPDIHLDRQRLAPERLDLARDAVDRARQLRVSASLLAAITTFAPSGRT
jgi:hypothetical protein